MPKLTNVPEGELRAEIARRDKVRRDQEEKERKEQVALWMTHIDTLLALVPKHSGIICDDKNPVHRDTGRCGRCLLLDARQEGIWYDDVFVEISVFRRKEKQER